MPEFDSTVEYRDAVGFPGYKVGNDGSVWSCRGSVPISGYGGFATTMRPEWRELKTYRSRRGYRRVWLCNGAPPHKRAMVHRVVLTAFVGPCPPNMEAAHDNGKPGDDRLENLAWKTPTGNNRDRYRHGTMVFGRKNGRAKLTSEQVIEMRRLHVPGKIGARILGKQFDISQSTASQILSGKIWRHLLHQEGEMKDQQAMQHDENGLKAGAGQEAAPACWECAQPLSAAGECQTRGCPCIGREAAEDGSVRK